MIFGMMCLLSMDILSLQKLYQVFKSALVVPLIVTYPLQLVQLMKIMLVIYVLLEMAELSNV